MHRKIAVFATVTSLLLVAASSAEPVMAHKAFALDLLESEYAAENLFRFNGEIGPEEREDRNARLTQALSAPHETNFSLDSATGTPRRESLSLKGAQALQSHLVNHPIAGPKATHARDVTGGVGFCFGRAYYVHIEALRAFRVNRDMIRKIWAIGTLDGPGIVWSYHVATMVKAQDRGWWVIDSFLGLQKAEDWMATVRRKLNGRKKDVGFYVTQANRFTPFSQRPYTKADLDDEAGYYLGYFNDLREYERTHPHPPYKGP